MNIFDDDETDFLDDTQDDNDIKVPVIKTVKQFMNDIEAICSDKKLDYIDAIIYYCDKNGLEIDVAAALIKSSSKMKARVQMNAEELNYLPKSAKLPI